MRKLKLYLTIATLLISIMASSLALYQEWQQSQVILGVSQESQPESSSPVAGELVVVSRVIDGDTIELEDGRKVRYIGIDTPETKHPTKGVQCFGKEATVRNKELVEGKQVTLEKDVNETDRYGRLLRYVWSGQKMINQQLVAEGYAYASSYPPDVKYQALLRQAQQQAVELNVGLWGSCQNESESLQQVIDQIDQQVLGATDQQTIDQLQPEDCQLADASKC